MQRRDFLTASAAAVITPQLLRGAGPNDRINVCVMGVRGRGGALLTAFAASPQARVKSICDLDPKVLQSRAKQVESISGSEPQKLTDFRAALDDPEIDALVIGTPDHWHALPTIAACQAGKDVYVEKPDGHNILEGRIMVAAAKKHKRIVQLGTQARSGTFQSQAMAYLAEGHLGKVRFAKAWESSRQGAIGYPKDSAPPTGVDYDTWLGPAPKRPFNVRRYHGSWRWFFDYGGGDLANDGVHRLDVARWAMQTARAAQGEKTPPFPKTISAQGGKYFFDDAQEWPDTLMATYDYGGCLLTYEMRIWSAYPLHGESEGAAVYGDQGYVVIGNRGWRVYDARGRQVSEQKGSDNTQGHVQNFLDCMRSRKKPNADLETVGHPSSLLCHLGNAAWKAGRTLSFDAENYVFSGDEDAQRLLTREEYRKPWTLPKLSEV